MRKLPPFLKIGMASAFALWLGFGAPLHARVEPTGTGVSARPDEEEDKDKEDPAARTQFRLLSLKSGKKDFNPNDLVKAKSHVKTMQASSTAWPNTTQAAPSGAVMPLTAGIQRTDWTAIGPGNIGGRTRSLVVDPTNPNILYLGAVGGGLWKSVNGGANWTVLSDFMASIAIGSLVIDPKNPNILYAGTGEIYPYDGLRGAGIFKSTNAGVTWTQLSFTANPNWYYVPRLAISPTNSQVLLACTQTGIWRTTDGGATWSLTTSDVGVDVHFHPTDGNKAVASTSANPAMWSADGGATWNVSTGMPSFSGRSELAIAKSNPNVMYASVYNNNGDLYRSTDGGHTWAAQNTGNALTGGQGWYDNAIWVDPLNENNLLLGGTGLLKSTNAGVAWDYVWVGELHADQHLIVEVGGYSATNRGVYVVNDGGIFKSDNFLNLPNSSYWVSLNHDLGVTQFYAGAGNINNGMVMGGTQDNGTPRYNGTYNGWIDIIGADGGWTASDPNLGGDGSSFWYGETQYWSTVRVHLDAAGNVLDNTYFYGSDENQELFIPPMILDPNDPQRLYKGGGRLWRLDNARTALPEAPWSVVRETGETISAIAVAPGNSNIIWVGHAGGTVMMTTNGLAAVPTWTTRTIGSNPQYRMCTRITIDPTNTNRVYATFGGFEANNVYKSEDAGLTWTDITSNLPDVPVRTLVVNKWNTNRIYIGTELGVFASENRGGAWSPSNEGPANASVDELFWVGNRLYAATHGRGMFRITVNTPPTASVTVPVNGANFAVGSNIAITATASDPDGSITKVEFFQNGIKISEDATSPYQATFANAPAGSYTLTAKATDNDNGTFTSAAVNITVGTVSGIALPGRIQAEEFKTGGEGVGYHDLTATNQGGAYRTAEAVDIEATTDGGPGYNVGYIDAGEWLAFNVNVATAGSYTFTARIASANAGTKTMAISVDGGAAIATFNTTDATGWQSFKDVVVSGVNLTAGAHVLRMSMTTGGFNLNYVDVAGVANKAPIANAGADKNANVNTLVTLDGRGSSDPDNGPSPLTYAWTKVAGPAVTLNNPTTSQPNFTPTATGTYGFELVVKDGVLSAKDTVLVNVTSGIVYINLPGRLQVEDYKTGGEGVGYHDLTAGNTGAVYRTDDVDIQATTDVGAGYNVGWTQAGEWLEYNVNVATTGNYTITARMASGAVGTKTVAVTVDGAAKGTFSTTDASGWQVWKDVVVSGISLTSGNHTLRITMNTADFNLNYLDFATAAGNQVPVANAGADKAVNVNTLVTLDGRASSDPDNGPSPLTYSWTKFSGPAATLNNANTSQPNFTPATTGTYVFRLTVSDGAASATDDIQVVVSSAPVGIALPGRIEAEAFKTGGENVGYHDLTATNLGGAYRTAEAVDIEATTDGGAGYNVGWIDAGEWLAFDVNVATAGSYTFTARIASGNAGTKTMAISVDGGAAIATFNTTDATGWQTFKDVVVSGVNLTAGAHVLRMSMTTGGFNINYVDVQAATANLIQNGDFSNGIVSWQTSVTAPATGTIANEAGAARISITNQGANTWEIQIFQQVSLTAGKVYTLDFDMKGEVTPKNFKVVVEHNADPWTKYHELQYTVTAAANTYQHYTITWTQSATDAAVRLGFHFGLNNVNDAWLDNVVLK
ncbi:MAG: hypothetical protein JWP91_3651 [Fibrobacteres bacterium]|nr:hypothetical protein [Fibrobacterota bacterium]